MKPHLRVPRREAQSARDRLRRQGALDPDYQPRHEDDWVLWPLREAGVSPSGDIVAREGVPLTRAEGDYRARLPPGLRDTAPRAFDVVGRIALLHLPPDIDDDRAAEVGEALLAAHPHLRTVARDRGVAGRYRVRRLVVVAGAPGLVARHREHGLTFEVDLARVFFSPRLAGERARVAGLVQPGERVLDLFAGAAPFAVAAAVAGAQVTAMDANPAAAEWAARNFAFNKVSSERYRWLTGRTEALLPELEAGDRLIMNHPTGALEYLPAALERLAPGGTVHLYLLLDRTAKRLPSAVAGLLPGDVTLTGTHALHPHSTTTEIRFLDLRRRLSKNKTI